jgi:ubiquinone/menaquinone biosynthesis C-methylase UbiE
LGAEIYIPKSLEEIMTSKPADEAKQIRTLWAGYWKARVFLTANNFEVFDHLTEERTALAVAKKTGADARAMAILLDALAGIGIIKKKAGKYKNTPAADKFLTRKSAYYQGDIVRHADASWKNWSGLDEVLKTGKPHRAARNHEAFILGMHNLSALKAADVLKAVGLKGVKTALDLGGGPATYAIEMAKKGVAATVFDRPETASIAAGVIKKSGVEGIKFMPGDFMTDDLGGGYDLVFISQIMHSFPKADNIKLLKKAQKALNKGGRVVVQEFQIDDSLASPEDSALFSVNMLINTEDGRCYAFKEIKAWLAAAGFKDVTQKKLFDSSLITGRTG